jgi:poly-gamma-glutamate synthesis protein (capsule biosynthesis protein)
LIVVGLLVAEAAFAGEFDLKFSNACAPAERTITVGFGGDLLMHMPVQKQGMSEKSGFSSLWPDLLNLFQSVGLAYLNLETPLSSHKKISSYPMFNTSAQLASDLVTSGIDLVSTANNHALDAGARGVDSTIENLNAAGLKYFGTRLSDGSGQWYVTAQVGGLNLAFVACTFSTNGITVKLDQVMDCFGRGETPSSELITLVQQLSVRPDISAVIVTPHWGVEYTNKPHASQKSLARALVDAGALAVVGTHPHVIQPWEKLEVAGGQEALVVYSTGNLTTNRKESNMRTSVFVILGISLNQGHLWINGVRYVPLYMDRDHGFKARPAELVSGGESGPGDLAAKYYGTKDRLRLNEPILTNPECF